MKHILIEDRQGQEILFNVQGFAGGERHVQLDAHPTAEHEELTIRARLNSSDDVFDLLLIENALRYQFGQALVLNLEVPYLPYARQDRVCSPGQSFSLEVFARLLASLNLKTMATWDCHSQVGIALTGAQNVSLADIVLSNSQTTSLLRRKKSVLVSPDKGAIARCTELQRALDLDQIIFCEKRRDPASGKILKTEVLADDLTGKTAVIVDDICDGGYTFIKIAEQLKNKNVERIVLFVTHGIFSKGLDVFDGLIDEVVTTTSFDHLVHPKLRRIAYQHNF